MENKKLVVRHGGLEIVFYKDEGEVRWDHITEPIITSASGEEIIQDLIQYAIQLSKTPEDLKKCMDSIREFYSYYLIDKSALNTLCYQLTQLMDDDARSHVFDELISVCTQLCKSMWPHPVEHPSMTVAKKRGAEILKKYGVEIEL